MSEHDEIDRVSGRSTTGHEWDGIKELNTPLPRWWVLTFYATIIWAIGYWIVYPAWPLVSGYTTGLFQYSTRASVATDLADLEKLRGEKMAVLAARRSPTSRRIRPCWRWLVHAARPCLPTTARLAMAAGVPVQRDIPT